MVTPLDPEITRALVAKLKPTLAKAGYKRNEQTWYNFSPELMRVLEFENGTSKPLAYFNLGIALRTKMGTVQPRAVSCSVHGRLSALIEDLPSLCDFGQPHIEVKARIETIVKAVETVALPFLNSFQTIADLQQAITSSRLRGFMIPQATRDLLSRISA